MKNKNQQIISLLKKEILKLKEIINESMVWHDTQKNNSEKLLAIIKQLQNEAKEKDEKIMELVDQLNATEVFTNTIKESNDFVLMPPKFITPENLEDGSIWE